MSTTIPNPAPRSGIDPRVDKIRQLCRLDEVGFRYILRHTNANLANPLRDMAVIALSSSEGPLDHAAQANTVLDAAGIVSLPANEVDAGEKTAAAAMAVANKNGCSNTGGPDRLEGRKRQAVVLDNIRSIIDGPGEYTTDIAFYFFVRLSDTGYFDDVRREWGHKADASERLMLAIAGLCNWGFGAALGWLNTPSTGFISHIVAQIPKTFGPTITSQATMIHNWFSFPFSTKQLHQGQGSLPFNPGREVGAWIPGKVQRDADGKHTTAAFVTACNDMRIKIEDGMALVRASPYEWCRFMQTQTTDGMRLVHATIKILQTRYHRGFGIDMLVWDDVTRCLDPATRASNGGFKWTADEVETINKLIGQGSFDAGVAAAALPRIPMHVIMMYATKPATRERLVAGKGPTE